MLANDTEPIYIPKRSHSISAIAKRLKEEEIARKKVLSRYLNDDLNDSESNFYVNAAFCAVFAGLFLLKEKDALARIIGGLLKA